MVCALVMAATLLAPPSTSQAATDTDPTTFQLIPADLEFMLKQIEIAEAHADGGKLLCASPTDKTGKCVPDPALPYGLRTVDGSFNNLLPGRSHYGSADQAFPRITPPVWSDAEAGPLGSPPNPAGTTDVCSDGITCYGMSAPDSFVYDSEPRTISNLIVDQTDNNPAALNAADGVEGSSIDSDGNVFIPNI